MKRAVVRSVVAISVLGLCATAVGAVGCSAADGAAFGESADADESDSASGGAGMGGSSGFDPVTSGGSQDGCSSHPDEDKDMDGFSVNQGDCNDCDANMNPGAIEVITDPDDPDAIVSDEDCDGDEDEEELCDGTIDLTDTDPLKGAAAIDLCHTVADDNFGVISAQYVRADGSPTAPTMQVGVLDSFGVMAPRSGARMLSMSSGHARSATQPNACGTLSCSIGGAGTAPAGFPQDVPNCSGSTNINDDVGFEVQLKAPTNATGYSYDFDFYSFEFPEWVCTSFNDQYVALVNPPPLGSIDGNISFDIQGNPVSVNIAFFEVCQFDSFYPQFPCALGAGELDQTGFDTWDDAGATSWLVTTAPVEPGEEFSIRFAIWDTGDTAFDSTVLIDNFTWIAEAGTVTVGTVPVPE